MPWQQYVADVALEVDDDGRYVYGLVLVTVPRQSGKTTLFGTVLDHRALTIPRARCWYTMQTAKDARDWLINEHFPLLAPFGDRVKIRLQAGTEHVKWHHTGGLVRPFPPTPAGLHGKISDLVVIDEAWAFDFVRGQQIDQAIVPTQATRPGAQVWKVSTAGDADSTWWLGAVEAGRAAVAADRRDGLAYFDWSVADGLDPCDPAVWPTYHPALDRTIGPAALEAALEILGPDEFARAYGNRWTATVSRVIPLAAWRAAADPDFERGGVGEIAVGFDVAVDRSEAAIVAARRRADGVALVEVIDVREGVSWLADRIVEIVDVWRPRAVYYDAAGPALDVADVLGRRGVTLDGLAARDYATACSAFLEALVTDPPTIRIRPNEALDAAANAAARRTLGDAWAWGRRKSATSIATLTAATCATWAADHAPLELAPFRVY